MQAERLVKSQASTSAELKLGFSSDKRFVYTMHSEQFVGRRLKISSYQPSEMSFCFYLSYFSVQSLRTHSVFYSGFQFSYCLLGSWHQLMHFYFFFYLLNKNASCILSKQVSCIFHLAIAYCTKNSRNLRFPKFQYLFLDFSLQIKQTLNSSA